MIRWLYVISLSGALISGQALYAQAGLPDSLVRERIPEAAPVAQQLEYSLHPGSGSRPYAGRKNCFMCLKSDALSLKSVLSHLMSSRLWSWNLPSRIIVYLLLLICI